MIEDGGWNCCNDETVTSTKPNTNLLRRQCQWQCRWKQQQEQEAESEGKRMPRGRMKIKKITAIVPFLLAILFGSLMDENNNNRNHQRSATTTDYGMVVLRVASFAPPLAPRVSATLPRDNSKLGSLPYTNNFPSRFIISSTKQTPAMGALKMTASSSTTTTVNINTTANATATNSMEESESETKKESSPNKNNKNNPTIRVFGAKNFIPPDQLDNLLDSVDIVALIESYGLPGFQRTSPQKATCICPFHDDHNPSLQINGEWGIYKCFSCGAGGNALKFVREYSEKSNKPLTFVDAVRVLDECAKTMPMVGGVTRRIGSSNGNSTSSRGNKKSLRRQKVVGSTPRERILYANLFAAAYFEESLFGLPSAGSARTHLRSRGVHPTTVKAFAIGFAPESYFLGGTRQNGPKFWGDGSLVYRLRDEGFTPQEIIDAGLATVTRKGKEQQKQQELQSQLQQKREQQKQLKEIHNETSSDNNNDDSGEAVLVPEPPQHEHKDFSTLMDRFRGRLVVPIFDVKGTHVLGFGGRILESSEDGNPDFKAAKYLNSPESLVFSKKELLFGEHMVKFESAATDSPKTATSTADTKASATATAIAKRRSRSLIIVEGYMDAIALWQAGVQETVACMGTALTREQLMAAAEKARDIGGRVVLCLDNDTAGMAAVTRLCSGTDPILLSVMDESNVDFFIAELSGTVKDPAEFLEEHRDIEEALDEKFRAEVIDGAQEWTRWYMNSLVAAHDPESSNTTAGDKGGFGQVFDTLASFLSIFESVDERMKKAAIIAPKLADLIDADKENDEVDFNRTEISSTTRIQLASDLVEKAANFAHLKSMNAQRNYQFSYSKDAIVPKSLEFSQDITLEEGSRSNPSQKKSLQSPPNLESSSKEDRSSRRRQKPPMGRQRARMKRQNSIKQIRKPMTKHISGVTATPFDDEWLGVTKDLYTNERNPLRFDHPTSKFSNQKYFGPEISIRFNKNDYHGTWTTPNAMAAGYVSQSNSKSLDFLDRGTSSLIESDGENQSLFVEDLLFTILARFSEARQSLHESIRISEASGSGGDVQWSAPEKEWLFNCLVNEIDEIPQGIIGLEDLSELRSYLSNRPDAIPGALGSTAIAVEQVDPKDETGDEVEESPKTLSIVDVSVDTVETSSEAIVEKVPNYEGDLDLSDESVTEHVDTPKMNSIPKIPAVGEEWSDFVQADGIADFGGDFGGFDGPMAFGDIDDALMDSVGPNMESFDATDSQEQIIDEASLLNTSSTGVARNISVDDSEDSETVGEAEIMKETDKSGFVDATFIAEDEEGTIAQEEGSLDRLFMEGAEICDIFSKFYADQDTMSLGSNGDKANWAIQNLYTMLQFTSVLKRVEAGRKYMGENKEDWFNATSTENHVGETDDALSSGIESSMAHDNTTSISKKQNVELAEYCSSQSSDGGLRSDLRRLRNLAEKNNQATARILAMMDADFTDRSADVRGYSWLGNVLKFNEMKMVEWNDIIESTENFQQSHEGLNDLEDIVYSDWNELSDPSEMWEFDRNVDLDHRSHFADLVIDRPDSESPDDFAKRYEEEWDVGSWEHESEQNQDPDNAVQDHEDNESSEEFLEQYETDWGDHDV